MIIKNDAITNFIPFIILIVFFVISACNFSDTANTSKNINDAKETTDDPGAFQNNNTKPLFFIKASNSGQFDKFGTAVDIHNNTMVVGSPGRNPLSDYAAGAVYVYQKIDDRWVEEAYITAPNIGESDKFGQSVAIYNDLIVVGAPYEDTSQDTIVLNIDDINDNDDEGWSGAVYVYRKINGIWQFEAYLKASNNRIGQEFGLSVDVYNNTIVVGSLCESNNYKGILNNDTNIPQNYTGANYSGAAYVYEYSIEDNWKQTAYIKAVNNDVDNWFGFKVRIYENTIAVAADSEDSSFFGIINGDTAPTDKNSYWSGAVYIYTRNSGIWEQQAYIKAPNNGADDKFGKGLSLFGDLLVVGAIFEDNSFSGISNSSSFSDNNDLGNSGSCYVFRRTGNIWNFEAYLKPHNPEAGDFFSSEICVYDDLIVIGAGDKSGKFNSSGAAYVYEYKDRNWVQIGFLEAYNQYYNTYFGSSAAVWGNDIIIGAKSESSDFNSITDITNSSNFDQTKSLSGAVYTFTKL